MNPSKNIRSSYFAENNIRYVFIDGTICDTIDKCYHTLQLQLSIPEYFGHNLDALEEVLADLEWVTEEQVQLIILSSTTLLQNELSNKDAFINILNSIDNKKIQVIYLN
jgi:RNAse (barnase) inhibitor barstar